MLLDFEKDNLKTVEFVLNIFPKYFKKVCTLGCQSYFVSLFLTIDVECTTAICILFYFCMFLSSLINN